MQRHLYKHFNVPVYLGLSNDISIPFIHKKDP